MSEHDDDRARLSHQAAHRLAEVLAAAPNLPIREAAREFVRREDSRPELQAIMAAYARFMLKHVARVMPPGVVPAFGGRRPGRA
jgi:hypothetical protein